MGKLSSGIQPRVSWELVLVRCNQLGSILVLRCFRKWGNCLVEYNREFPEAWFWECEMQPIGIHLSTKMFQEMGNLSSENTTESLLRIGSSEMQPIGIHLSTKMFQEMGKLSSGIQPRVSWELVLVRCNQLGSILVLRCFRKWGNCLVEYNRESPEALF